jgi:hypothetical protein
VSLAALSSSIFLAQPLYVPAQTASIGSSPEFLPLRGLPMSAAFASLAAIPHDLLALTFLIIAVQILHL